MFSRKKPVDKNAGNAILVKEVLNTEQHVDEKSKVRKHPERGQLLESPYAEPFENYL